MSEARRPPPPRGARLAAFIRGGIAAIANSSMRNRMLWMVAHGRIRRVWQEALRMREAPAVAWPPARSVGIDQFQKALETARDANGPGPLVLVDHRLGGGANKFSASLAREALARGVPVVRVLPPRSGKGAVVRREGTNPIESRVRSLGALSNQIRNWRPSRIVLASAIGYASPLHLLEALSATAPDVPTHMVVHDFHAICPSFHLLHKNGSYCGIPAVQECHRCLPENPNANPFHSPPIEAWREGWRKFLAASAEVQVLSQSSRQLMQRVFPEVRPVVVRPPTAAALPRLAPRKGPLRMAAIGAITEHKGSRILQEIADAIARREPQATVIVVGTLDRSRGEYPVEVLGPYEVEELPRILDAKGVNMILFPSIVPETYSYTLSEAMQLGLPVACLALGAQAERVSSYPKGLVISGMDPVSAAAQILSFHSRMNDSRGDGAASFEAGV